MEVFRYLSTPMEGEFKLLAAELAATQYAAFCQRALKRAPAGSDVSLIERIVQTIGERPATVAYWTPEVGSIFAGAGSAEAPRGRTGDWAWIHAQTAVSGYLTGLLERIELDTRVASPLLICGRSFAGALEIEGADGHLSVRCDDGTQARFDVVAQRDDAPVWSDARTPDALVRVDGQPAIRLVGNGWHGCDWIEQECADVAADAHIVAQYEAGLDLLKRLAPEYYQWVTCLLKEITPLRRPAPHAIASNSSALRMGGIDIATPASASETAEMLVHECSHQYYHMCSWLGSTVTPDAKPYYSPLKKCERPLDRILLGYHAFGNAMIVFDRMAGNGMQAQISDRWSTVAGYMDQLVQPLEDQRSLSELGQAVYAPLRTRLDGLAHPRPTQSAAA